MLPALSSRIIRSCPAMLVGCPMSSHPTITTRPRVAQVNETLAKVLCHNLVVLIHEMYKLGIDPVFWE